MYVPRVLGTVSLQGAEIVPVAQIGKQPLENRPIPVTGRCAEFAFQMTLQIILNVVVIEQRVIHIDEEYCRIGGKHLRGSLRADLTRADGFRSTAGPPALPDCAHSREC